MALKTRLITEGGKLPQSVALLPTSNKNTEVA
jgi:hypothetical protein